MWLVMVPATAAWLSIPPRVGKLTTRGPSFAYFAALCLVIAGGEAT